MARKTLKQNAVNNLYQPLATGCGALDISNMLGFFINLCSSDQHDIIYLNEKLKGSFFTRKGNNYDGVEEELFVCI